MGNEVTVYSKLGGVVTEKAREAGIECIDHLDPLAVYDVIHLNQSTSKNVMDIYTTPMVYTVHSEFECEKPLKDPKIKKYIAIRPSIATKWGLDAEIIYNPIDFTRFHPFTKPDKELVLFVGTIDQLRSKAAQHLIESGRPCRFVGKKFSSWADGLPNWFDSTWDIEEHLAVATETAGIMMGRTTLEGYACGLPATIYDVDEQANIKSITKHPVPDDMSPFDSKLVAKAVLAVYNSII